MGRRKLPLPEDVGWYEAVSYADVLDETASTLLDVIGPYPASRNLLARRRWRGQLSVVNSVRFRAAAFRRRANALAEAAK